MFLQIDFHENIVNMTSLEVTLSTLCSTTYQMFHKV
jgi:hypothetical protein